MRIMMVIQTYYPIALLLFMFVICLMIAARIDRRREQFAEKTQSTEKIDRLVHNSDNGVDAAEYAELLMRHDVRYVAW